MPYIFGDGKGTPLERETEGGLFGRDLEVDFANFLALLMLVNGLIFIDS